MEPTLLFVVSRGVDYELQTSDTQRTVLSFVSWLFDHIRLAVPHTVRARPLLKDYSRGRSFPLDNEWPFKPNLDVVSNIFSKTSVDYTIGNSTRPLKSIFKKSEPVYDCEKYSKCMKLRDTFASR